ncbi:MAG: alcohol dehydrogenase catalytic domain-containing protein [Actinobacteria bacterium]|nr:alcohol dehydrogenase catalytic domain-containing protein [Actinomycetota bacterium]
MRAARFLGDGEIRVEQRAIPVPGPSQVLVRVDSCALCGTDRGAYSRGSTVTPGHEIAGTVIRRGENVLLPQIGARGVVYLVNYCGTCYCCRSAWTNMCLDKKAMYGFNADGGYADYVVVEAKCFLPIDDAIPLDAATALLDLYGSSRHAFARSGLPSPETVAIVGCGPIGIGAVTVARALGANEVAAIDVSPYRLELVRSLGATPIDARNGDPVARALAGAPDGYQIVIEAAGMNATQQQAIEIAAPNGRVVFVGHNQEPLEVRTLQDLIQVEKVLLGSEYFPVGEFARNHQLLGNGALDPTPVLTHRFTLDDIGEAFNAFMSGESGKVLVRP